MPERATSSYHKSYEEEGEFCHKVMLIQELDNCKKASEKEISGEYNWGRLRGIRDAHAVVLLFTMGTYRSCWVIGNQMP